MLNHLLNFYTLFLPCFQFTVWETIQDITGNWVQWAVVLVLVANSDLSLTTAGSLSKVLRCGTLYQ